MKNTVKIDKISPFEGLFSSCIYFGEIYPKNGSVTWAEFCHAKLGITPDTFGDILQMADTGVYGRNIDEFYNNTTTAIGCSKDWNGATKEQIAHAIKTLLELSKTY